MIAEIRAWATFAIALVTLILAVYLAVSWNAGEGVEEQTNPASSAAISSQADKNLGAYLAKMKAKLLTTSTSELGGPLERGNVERQVENQCRRQ
jgi:hypothetical protein